VFDSIQRLLCAQKRQKRFPFQVKDVLGLDPLRPAKLAATQNVGRLAGNERIVLGNVPGLLKDPF
jgi:hypothetical protein